MSPKPKQTAHFVTCPGHSRTFRLGYGGRATLSVKGAQQFWMKGRMLPSTKFPRVPMGQTFDRPRLALPFLGCAERYGSAEIVPLLLRFFFGRLGNRMGTVHPPCLLFPAVKVYNGGKKFWRKNQNENSSHLCALQ